jgi:hypothetical protein
MERFNVPRSDVWLADDNYDHLPDFNGTAFIEGTRPSVETNWKSPFVGKTLAEVAAWVSGIPKPPKAVCKTFFVVLKKELYESQGMVFMCKFVEGETEPQTLPYLATDLARFRAAYHRDNWQEDWEEQFRD